MTVGMSVDEGRWMTLGGSVDKGPIGFFVQGSGG